VINYAASKYVEVIPEIEMPGHASAALAAYSWLGCKKDTTYTVVGTWGVFEDVFCTTDNVFTFLENVLTEVMDLFPSEYIHIGGDECPKDHWKKCPHCQSMIKKHKLNDEHELQSYFVQRIEKFVNAHGKKIIGWDEILEGGLAPNATVMSWRGEQGGIEAAMQHHDVIMTPTSYLYFDYYQSDNKEAEPLAIGGFVPLEKVYSFNPVPDVLPADKKAHIIGVQANLWTEYIPDAVQAEYMAYPRASALSEIAWTANERKDFAAFCQRLQSQFKRFDYLKTNYGKHYKGEVLN
jgi:hexosaminidase